MFPECCRIRPEKGVEEARTRPVTTAEALVIFLGSVNFLSARINSFILMVTIYFILDLLSKGLAITCLKVDLPIPEI